jgi:hypothetical protein
VAQVVQKYSAGIVLDDFTTEAYTDAAARLDELLSLDRRTIRRGAEAYYDLRGATRTYDALYASLLGTRPLAQMPANVASEG